MAGVVVESIRSEGRDALAEGFPVGDGSSCSLEIVFKANGGSAACTVTTDAGEPVRDAHVVLVPEPPMQGRVSLFGDCATQDDGACTITGMRPGSYHAYAFPTQSDLDYRDPDALAPLATYAAPARLDAGERVQVHLHPAPTE